MGRPAIPYSEEIADNICDITASSEKSLATILKENEGYPKVTTIYKWLDDNQEFAKNYARAKICQAHFLAEGIIEIADDSSQDLERIDDYGNRIENKEFVNRSKIRIDARKWHAAHLYPKKYGDKLELEGAISTPANPDLLDTIVAAITSNSVINKEK